jgi:hypothetical protein
VTPPAQAEVGTEGTGAETANPEEEGPQYYVCERRDSTRGRIERWNTQCAGVVSLALVCTEFEKPPFIGPAGRTPCPPHYRIVDKGSLEEDEHERACQESRAFQ